MFTITSRRNAVASAAVLVALASGCTNPTNDMVSPKVDVTDHSRSALTASGIEVINGVYTGCSGRSDGEAWSALVNGALLAHPALAVRMNDSNCELTVTEVVASGTTYAGAPNILLATSYAGSASAFKAAAEDPVAFYANAKIDSLTFGADFTINLLISDDTNDSASGSKQGAFATQSSTVDASNVPAPSYTISLADLTMLTDVNDRVTSATGYAQLTEGAATGQTFAISSQALTSSATLEQLATAYSGASSSGNLADLTSLRIPASSFGLVGQDVSAGAIWRTVIIRNTDAASGVTSYQLIVVTFAKP